MKNITPDNPYTTTYDLTNCDNEPIHIIQTVQSFASIIAIDAGTFYIRQLSSNISQFIQKDASQLLEQSLSDFFPSYVIDLLKKGIEDSDFSEINPITLPINELFQQSLMLVAHQSGDQLILEIEQVKEKENDLLFLNKIDNAIQRIQFAPTLQKLFQAVAIEVKNIAGYDRVMIYKFDEAYNGRVIAEEKEDELEPFLGLNYPSTDIPKQARQLYLKNRVRIISDVSDKVSMIQPPLHPDTGQPLTVSNCAARGVSPIHLEYLKNMGVKASLSVAIIEDEKLWGLIACHHYTDNKALTYRTRNLIRFMGQIISGHLSLYRAKEFREKLLEKNKIHASLSAQINTSQDLINGLTQSKITIQDYIPSIGAVVDHDGEIERLGKTPDEDALRKLTDYLTQEVDSLLFSTDCLADIFPENEIYGNEFAGLLSVKISNDPAEYMMWFRQPQSKEVLWGGNPEKAMSKENESVRMSPRKSFSKWKQVIQHKSEPWQKYEKDAAITLRNDIKDIILKRFQELKKLNSDLKSSYEELESFSYSVSHDLRSPLRAIEGFSQILLEDYVDKLDDYGVEVLNTIVESINKMNQFVNDILTLSKLAKIKMIYNEVEVISILPSIISDIKNSNKAFGKVKVFFEDDIPSVPADHTMVKQLFYNLIGNAVKYSAVKEQPQIHIGGKVEKNSIIFYVKDNGIGMDMEYAPKIFDVFSRLVTDEEFEGTGIGLSIVKRIMERHQGEIKVESEIGEGSTFWVIFPKVENTQFLE